MCTWSNYQISYTVIHSEPAVLLAYCYLLVHSCTIKLMLLSIHLVCSFSGIYLKDVATLLPPAVAMRGPATLRLLSPALWAEGLLGFCHGQYGQRRDDVNDEGWGRKLRRGGDPAPWRTHVPVWLPLSAQGRPVFWPRSVRVCVNKREKQQRERKREMHVCDTLSSFLRVCVCVCVRQEVQKGKQMSWMAEWVSMTRALHDFHISRK